MMSDNEKDMLDPNTESTDKETKPDTEETNAVSTADDFQFLGDPTAQNTTDSGKKTLLKRLAPIIALCVVAVMLFSTVAILKHAVPEDDPNNTDTSNEDEIKIFDLNGASADRLEIKNVNDEFAFVKKLQKTYYIEGKEDNPVSNAAILTTLTYFGDLSAVAEVEKGVTDFEQYGLNAPLSTVTWTKGDTKHFIEIGALAPSDNYYMRVDGGDTVYTLNKTTASYFLSPRMDFYDTTVFEFNKENDSAYINYFSIKKKGQEELVVELQDLTDEELFSAYLITAPIEHSLSVERSDGVISLIEALNTLTVYDDDLSPEKLKKYGLDDPEYTFTYRNVQDVHTAYFGKTSDQGYVYMYAEGKNFVYIIDEATINILTYDIAGYCESMSYTRSYDTIDKLTITGGGKSYEIVISGTAEDEDLKAYINGKYVEYENFASLYAHIIGIRISSIGNKTPNDDLAITIKVDCKDGTTDVIRYYKQTDLDTFFELNGSGRLLVPTSEVEKILTFAQQLYDGEEIVLGW